MELAHFKHKNLRRLYEDDDAKGLPPASVRKIKAIFTVLEFADELAQAATFPGWKLHPLKGEKKGYYSITVTANWRLTFRLESKRLLEIDLEDYH